MYGKIFWHSISKDFHCGVTACGFPAFKVEKKRTRTRLGRLSISWWANGLEWGRGTCACVLLPAPGSSDGWTETRVFQGDHGQLQTQKNWSHDVRVGGIGWGDCIRCLLMEIIHRCETYTIKTFANSGPCRSGLGGEFIEGQQIHK